MKNIGKFVGWCFYFGAFLDIVGSIYVILTTHEIKLSFAFMVMIVIGYYLTHHNKIARKLALFLSGFNIALCSLLMIIFTFIGIDGVFHIYVYNLEIAVSNLMSLYIWSISAIVLTLIPFILLKSKKAIQEFEINTVSV